MTTRDERRRGLAEHLRAERQERFGSKAKAVAESGLARATWDRLEAGGQANDYTWARVEKLFGWPRGSVQRYLDDDAGLPTREQPVEAAQAPSSPATGGGEVADTPEGMLRVDALGGLDGLDAVPGVTALFAHYGAHTTREKTEALLQVISAVQQEAEAQQAQRASGRTNGHAVG